MGRRALVLVTAALALAAAPSTAPAAVTTVNLSSPADGAYLTVTDDVAEVTFAGTAPGASDSDLLDVWCVRGLADHPLVDDMAVTSGGFSEVRPASLLPPGTCRIMVVPDGTDVATADLSAFDDALVTTEYRRDYRSPPGASGSPDVPEDFQIAHQQARGLTRFFSAGGCGLCGSRLFYDDTKTMSEMIFSVSGYLNLREPSPHDRSGVRVDGHNAWGPNATYLDLDPGPGFESGSEIAGMPPLARTLTGAGPGEDMTIDEGYDLVRCELGDPWPVTKSGCGRFVPAGVRFERRTAVTDDGTLIGMIDVLRSLDGRPHTVDMLYTEGMQHADAGFAFPWVGDGYATHVTGDTVPGTAGPASFFVRTKNTAPDGDRRFAQGVIVHDRPIGQIVFTANTQMLVPIEVTVPEGGSATVRHAYAMARTRAELTDAARRIEDRYVPPTLEITTPAEGATVGTAIVDVTGRVRDDRGVTAFTVDGRPVPPAADGAWSTPVSLRVGENTIVAVARDAAGNEVTARRKVTYAPPPPPPRALDTVAPTLSAVSRSATRFRATATAAAAPRGTRVLFTVSEA
ncbi:MAG TPA: hypothetical protein VGW10_16865, partial [Solirubrobacteraceae bacterium]|nr:hypothetical protein [Solirubrobacteraceae bacterium]